MAEEKPGALGKIRVPHLILLVPVLFFSATAAVVLKWRQTPYGQMTTAAAVISRVATLMHADAGPLEAASMRAGERSAARWVLAAPPPAQVKDFSIPGPDPAARTNPEVSPLLAANHAGLPPALIVTAQFDQLRDEGEAYAAALRKGGVPVHQHRMAGVIHGFVQMDGLYSESDQALTMVAEHFKKHAEPAAR